MATIVTHTSRLLIAKLDGIEALILGNKLNVSTYCCYHCKRPLNIHSVYYLAHINRFCCIECLTECLSYTNPLEDSHFKECMKTLQKLL